MYKVPEHLKDVNLIDIGYYTYIDWDMLDEDIREELMNEGYDRDTPVGRNIIDKYGLWDISGDYEYDDDIVLAELEGVIKQAPHYIVMCHNCTWNGASGFLLTEDLAEAFQREYEASIYPLSTSKGGKCLICKESSHDVPTGSKTSITALTESEYNWISHWLTKWDDVAAFVEKCERRAV